MCFSVEQKWNEVLDSAAQNNADGMADLLYSPCLKLKVMAKVVPEHFVTYFTQFVPDYLDLCADEWSRNKKNIYKTQ